MQRPVLSDAIQIHDIELPVKISLFFDEKVLIFEVADIEARGVERVKKFSQDPKERAPPLPGPSRLSFSPVDVEWHLREECFAHVEAFANHACDASLHHSKRARSRDACDLEELRSLPRSSRWRTKQHAVSPTPPGTQSMMFDNERALVRRKESDSDTTPVLEYATICTRKRRTREEIKDLSSFRIAEDDRKR
jgi:hypothetical protein